MSQETTPPESLEFRAQVRQLLHILANSLYTEREIFLRELISNASDALHRIQFEMLTNRDVHDAEAELAIRLDFDAEARTLTVSDSGVGMTRDELVENLGTIAHSGAMAFLKGLEEGTRPDDIIGQFGVGFYSVFMVAEQVVVTSRSYQPDAGAWRWASDGGDSFTLTPAEKEDRGTTIAVQLKEDAAEFASAWRLERIVKKHSDYVSFPIYLEDRVINRQAALWRQSPQDVEAQEYAEFYRQLTLDLEEPLLHVHFVVDAPINIRALLYVPRRRERGVLSLRTEGVLRLYSKKILIQESHDLLPEYLQFVQGVVDSEDLPLNISRETVQSSWAVRQIQRTLVGRLIKRLNELAEESPADYAAFWREFGPYVKHGLTTDPLAQKDLLPLLRFPSSRTDGDLTSLADYVARMADDQAAIYYLQGPNQAAVAHSPHLDAFKNRDLEVLYLLDPLDGFMIQALQEYEGKRFQSVDDAGLELPEAAESPAAAEQELPPAEFERVVARFQQVLGERVSAVRASKLLVDSPCRLVSTTPSAQRDLQRVQRLMGQEVETPPLILELNPHHPLIQNLARRIADQPDHPLIDPGIEQTFDNLLLLEGLHPDPAQMVPRIQELLEAAMREKD
ncbi:MAG: molecular chaperone HtpG [Anaerolineae bacterium]|nr:molecular chaperone HtpG [Anaerolineae bacterium]